MRPLVVQDKTPPTYGQAAACRSQDGELASRIRLRSLDKVPIREWVKSLELVLRLVGLTAAAYSNHQVDFHDVTLTTWLSLATDIQTFRLRALLATGLVE